MQYRKLGHSGTAVSKLALGTMNFGSQTPEDDAFAIMDVYVEVGGNLIDTANVYNGGLAEEIVGRWFNSRPADMTDRVVLTTKGRAGDDSIDPNAVGLSRRTLQRALDASLRRMKVDHVDLYQLHASDMKTPMEETLAFLDDAVRAGKMHYVGISNFTGWELQRFVSTAREMGAPVPVTLQPQYSLLSRESEYEIVPAAIHNGLGLLPWSPLAGGFLSGKYRRGVKPASDTRAGSDSPLYQWVSEEYANIDQNWTVIDAVVKIAADIGATPSQVALSWIADRPGVTAPIFGARTLAQLKDSIAGAQLALDETATAALEVVSRPRPGGYPYGAFGQGQRNRNLHDGVPAPGLPVWGGSEHPTGRA
jgi:aryl-alcohol dehydrogenase-like predicted oxidoreductase